MTEMMVDCFKAMIRFVPDMQMFRGELKT